MKQYGILAHPAKHSLSPVMHNAAFRAVSYDAQYGVFDIPEAKFGDFLEQVKHDPINGLSVSLPYKEMIIPHLDEVSEDAKAIGAVNTVVNKGGFLHGYNTDFVGSNKALDEVSGKSVAVIGAGGAARAIVYGLLQAGADVKVIINRGLARAQALADDFGGIEVKSLEEIAQAPTADILIQTTSIWTLDPEAKVEDFCPQAYLKNFETVMDICYKPLKTPLLEAAERLGLKIITGEKMLLYQAAEQFKLWTEKEAPLDVMEEVLLTNLV